MIMMGLMHLATIPLMYIIEIFPFLKPILVEAPIELLLKFAEWAR